jgi:vitamin B12 transporter
MLLRNAFILFSLVTMPGSLDGWHTALAGEPEVTTLEPVLVTGTAHPTRLHRVTQSTTVIPEKQFSNLQTNRIAGLLQQVPGIHIDEMGTRGGLSSLYVRGGNPNFTLILLDGIPLNDSTNQRGGSVDLSTLPIENISRVEIVRGPLSSIYGNEGMAGAINFITRSADSTPHVRLLGEAGRFESYRGTIQGGGSLGPLSTRLSLTHSQNGEQVENDRFAMTSIGWAATWDGHADWDLRLNGQYSHATTRVFPEGSGGPLLAVLRETEQRDTDELVTGLSLASAHPSVWAHHLRLNVLKRTQTITTPGIQSNTGIVQLPPAFMQTHFHRVQSSLIETWNPEPEWTVSLGGQLTYENGERSGIQDLSQFGGSPDTNTFFFRDRVLGGLFAEATWSPYETLAINPGIRMDLSQGFHPQLSPRIGASYAIQPWLKIRGGYGSGFKLPSLTSLGDPQIGNPHLNPETSTGWDVGFIIENAEAGVTASLEYFHTTYRNLIDLDPTLLNQGIFRLANLEDTTTNGVEGSFTMFPTKFASLNISTTYLETRIHTTGEPLRNRPKWRTTGVLTLQVHPTLTLMGRIVYVGSRLDFQIPTQTTVLGEYTRLDLTLTHRPSTVWNWYLALENLTNHPYEEYRGFPSPPLTFRFGLEYQMDRNRS